MSRKTALPDPETVRSRAYEISQSPESGTPLENWLRAEEELTGARPRERAARRSGHEPRVSELEVVVEASAADDASPENGRMRTIRASS